MNDKIASVMESGDIPADKARYDQEEGKHSHRHHHKTSFKHRHHHHSHKTKPHAHSKQNEGVSHMMDARNEAYILQKETKRPPKVARLSVAPPTPPVPSHQRTHGPPAAPPVHPMEPETTILPGAHREGGLDDDPTTLVDYDDYTITAPLPSMRPNQRPPTEEPVEARLVSGVDISEEELHRLQGAEHELDQIRRNAAVAVRIDADPVESPRQDVEDPYSNDSTSPARMVSISSWLNRPRTKWLLGIAVLLAVAAIVGSILGVFLLSKEKEEPTPTESTPSSPTTTWSLETTLSNEEESTMHPQTTTTALPTNPPTTLPEETTAPATSTPGELPTTTQPPTTQAPEDPLMTLLSLVSLDGGTALRKPTTPQNDAYNWLNSNTNLDSYSNERKIQRYALATVYYSMNGNSWDDSTYWLSEMHECEWYNKAPNNVFCVNENVAEFELWGNGLVGTIPPEISLLSSSIGTLYDYIMMYISLLLQALTRNV